MCMCAWVCVELWIFIMSFKFQSYFYLTNENTGFESLDNLLKVIKIVRRARNLSIMSPRCMMQKPVISQKSTQVPTLFLRGLWWQGGSVGHERREHNYVVPVAPWSWMWYSEAPERIGEKENHTTLTQRWQVDTEPGQVCSYQHKVTRGQSCGLHILEFHVRNHMDEPLW